MNYKYEILIPIGAAVVFIFAAAFLFYKSRKKPVKGIKIASLNLIEEESYFKFKKNMYYLLRVLLALSLCAAIFSSFMLLARPYERKKMKEEKYSRDIIICLDISTSVNELNMKLLKELKNTVRELNGERIGIVIFNTSPVLVSPLTDDYEFTLKQLDDLYTGIKVTSSTTGFMEDDYLYWDSYVFGGTLIGNEKKGSSLIADGLVGAMLDFPKSDKDRTRVIIFATDNDPNGTQVMSLQEACDLCSQNKITVYGIGTKSMYKKNILEMQAAVESTGGKYYEEENASTFHNIVEDIEALSSNLTEGKTFYRESEKPQVYFTFMVIFILISIISGALLSRYDLFWIIRQCLTLSLVVAIFMLVVTPANRRGMGNLEAPKKYDSSVNVFFAIDNTISMVANDYGDGNPRMEGVKKDCSDIIDSLEGSKISVMRFDNSATILSPLSNNAEHVKNLINTIEPMYYLYAKGSNLSVAKDTLLQTLKMAKKSNPGSRNYVFFISDGEITNKENLESFSALKEFTDGGAVLGYGTPKGGNMWYFDSITEAMLPLEDRSRFPYELAVSVIDEDNLKSVAQDIGISYVNMNDQKGLDQVLGDITRHIDDSIKEVKDKNKTDAGINDELISNFNFRYLLLIPVIILLMFEAFMVIRKK